MPRPNNYIGNEGSYGRVTGLGSVPCSEVTVPVGFVGPIDCDPTEGGPVYPVSQNQISNIWGYLNDIAPNGEFPVQTPYVPASITPLDMLKTYWPLLAVGVGAVLLLKDRR